MNQQILQKEKEHLRTVLDKLQNAKSHLERSMTIMGKETLEKLKDLRENPETSGADFYFFMEQLHEKNAAYNIRDKYKRLEEIETAVTEPYFARIDLCNQATKETKKVYIGKFGYTEETPIITDWRAKIAAVYYRYRYPQKNVKYNTPSGTKTRDLLLKRTFEIDKGQLLKYYNNDIQLDESEIIIEKIEQRTGGVLEDIVETIQESQLDIIETDPRQVCIVQGCVGSGKSTVAIHKLSHIFFNYPKLIRPERSILIAKNQILVGYLSTLFPKLGIFDINYKTLQDLIYNVIFREELNVQIDFELPYNLTKFDLENIQKLKTKINTVHSTYKKKISNIFLEEDFETFGGFAYNKKQTTHENITDITKDLEEELKYQKEILKDNPKSTQAWLHQSNIIDLRKILNKLNKLKRELLHNTIPQILKETNIRSEQKLNYANALIYTFVYSELIGFKKTLQYEYCVVDEGQDFSALEYLVLSRFVLNSRLCILGDLNQGYGDERISGWKALQKCVPAKMYAEFELDTNYRSTKPIIDLANNILLPYTQSFLPKSINRKGKSPEITTLDGYQLLTANFKQKMQLDTKNLDKSIGIICFNDAVKALATNVLNEVKIPADKYIKLDPKKPVRYIPKGVYLMNFDECKGLEFAKVYVLGLNLDDIKDFTEAKKAFVAVTRAMNEVVIMGIKRSK
jgi:DNA helicase II / ATP-dependent DNA helicase PcrA